MRSNLNQQLKHERNSKGILLPLMEDFMRRPVNIETQDDVDFLTSLFQMMSDRESRRQSDDAVFSPSALAECLRKVYLKKHSKALQIPPLPSIRMEPNYYFLNGNFIHIKWQFALYKMEKKINDPEIFTLYAVEHPIMSKRKDHGGTTDCIVLVYSEPYIVDFKGLNVRSFGEITRAFVPHSYEIQLVDYMALWNSQKSKDFRIEKSLLMVENKGGPDAKHPIALHEHVITMKEHHAEVKLRLEALREHEAKKKIPKPECTSTKTFQFQGCPFYGFCKDEVKEIEKANRAKSSDTPLKVARPTRKARARRG